MFQISNSLKAKSKEEFAVLMTYWVCSLISGVLIGHSYKTGKLAGVKYAYIIFTLRNSLRLYNFENTEEDFGIETV